MSRDTFLTILRMPRVARCSALPHGTPARPRHPTHRTTGIWRRSAKALDLAQTAIAFATNAMHAPRAYFVRDRSYLLRDSRCIDCERSESFE